MIFLWNVLFCNIHIAQFTHSSVTSPAWSQPPTFHKGPDEWARELVRALQYVFQDRSDVTGTVLWIVSTWALFWIINGLQTQISLAPVVVFLPFRSLLICVGSCLLLKTRPVYLLLIGGISRESVSSCSLNLLSVCVCGAMEADTAAHQSEPLDEPLLANSWGQEEIGALCWRRVLLGARS